MEGCAERELAKGLRENVFRAVSSIAEAFATEKLLAKPPRRQPVLHRQTVEKGRKTGPWRILEVFSCTCALAMTAAALGWVVIPFVPRQKSWSPTEAYLQEHDPDLIMVKLG